MSDALLPRGPARYRESATWLRALMFVLLLVSAITATAETTNDFVLVGQYPPGGHGELTNLRLFGNYAYCTAAPGGLCIVDVSNPTRPTTLGYLQTPGYSWDLDVIGSTVYVADGDAGLQIMDASNPAEIRLLGSYDTPGEARAVRVANGLAYVADGLAGVLILDIRDPSRIALKGRYDTLGSARDLKLSGSLAYVADGPNGLCVLDVRDPQHVTEVGRFDVWGDAQGVELSGNVALVSIGRDIHLLDVSQVTSIRWLSKIWGIYYSWFRRMQVAGNSLFASDQDQMYVWNLHDPEQPTYIGDFAPNDSYETTCGEVRGQFAYVGGKYGKVHVFDVSNPAKPKQVDSISYFDSRAGHFQVVGNMILGQPIQGSGNGIQVVDLANPAQPRLVRTILTNIVYSHFEVQGSILYAVGGSVLSVYDIRDLSNTAFLGSFDTGVPSPLRKVHLGGDRAYLLGTNTTIRVVSVADPAHMKLLGSVYVDWETVDFQVVGTKLFLAALHSGFQVIEAQNPAGMFWTYGYGYDTEVEVEDLHVVGNRAYVADNDSLQIFDVTRMPGITRFTRFTGAQARSVSVSGSYAFVADDGICSVDVSAPSSPRVAARIRGLGGPLSVRALGNMVYVAQDGVGWYFLRHRVRTIQALSFQLPTEILVTAPPLRLQATIDSGLPITFSVVSGPAEITGDQLSWTSAGTIVVRADQPGSETVAPARVEQTLTVRRIPQTLTIGPVDPSMPRLNAPVRINATASSGLPVTIELESGPALWVGNNLVITNSGSVVVRAVQSGDAVFEPASIKQVLYPLVQQPALLGEWPGGAVAGFGANDVYVSGTRAYLANGTRGFEILDISNPKAITQLGHADTPGDCLALQVVGGTAYVADWTEGFETFSVTNPASPRMLGHYKVANNQQWLRAEAVQVVGTNAYVAGGDFWTFDVGNPTSIQYVRSERLSSEVFSILIVGKTTYLGKEPIYALDPRFAPVGQPFGGFALAAQGNLLYSSSGRDFYVLDAANPSLLRQLGGFSFLGESWIRDIAVTNSRAYVTCGTNGLSVLDVSEPGRVVRIGRIITGGDSRGMHVIGNTAYVADGPRGLTIFDLGAARFLQELAFPVPVSPQPPNTRLTLQASSSSGLPVSYSVQSGPGVLTNGNELLLNAPGVVAVEARQEGDASFAPAPAVNSSIIVASSLPPGPLVEAWVASAFPSIPVSKRGLADDPDLDGASNGMEWLLGSDPSKAEANAGRLPTGTLTHMPDGTSAWTLHLTFGSMDAAESAWMLEQTSSLNADSWGPLPPARLERNGLEFQITLPLQGGPLFLRLRLGG